MHSVTWVFFFTLKGRKEKKNKHTYPVKTPSVFCPSLVSLVGLVRCVVLQKCPALPQSTEWEKCSHSTLPCATIEEVEWVTSSRPSGWKRSSLFPKKVSFNKSWTEFALLSTDVLSAVIISAQKSICLCSKWKQIKCLLTCYLTLASEGDDELFSLGKRSCSWGDGAYCSFY